MPFNIGLGEIAVCFGLAGTVLVVAVVVLLALRGRGLAARCPLCTASISRRAVVCPNCKRDLPEGWLREKA